MAPGGVLTFLKSSAVARYACGFKNVRALPGTKIYYFRMGTSEQTEERFQLVFTVLDKLVADDENGARKIGFTEK